MSEHPVDLTAESFEQTTGGPGLVLVDFWAEWCGPCRAFAPTYAATAAKHPDVVFGKVDTEAHEALSGRFDIQSIPTLMAFKDGVVVHRSSGAMPAARLDALVASLKALDVASAKRAEENKKLTEQGIAPPGVHPDAVWDDGDSEWVHGPKDAKGRNHGPYQFWRADGTLCNECVFKNGKPHGPFKRFHENGEVSQDGEFVNGELHGPRTWYATDSVTTERMHENGVSEKVRKTVMVYDHGRVVGVKHYDAKGQRLVPSTGEPYPERPTSVPEQAELREDLGQWSLVQLNKDGERHGVARFWTQEGELLWEGEFVEGSRKGFYRSLARDEYQDPRVVYDEGEYDGDLACGAWKLLDADRKVVLTRDLGVAQDEETMTASGVFSNRPLAEEAWRELAERCLAERNHMVAVLATARAVAQDADVTPLKELLARLTLPRTPENAQGTAGDVLENAGQYWAPMAETILRGGDAAMLLRGYAVLMDQHDRPRAALDFIHAAMLLAPERTAYLFTRGLILLNMGLDEHALVDADGLAKAEPDTADFLRTYTRSLFPRFDFWPAKVTPHSTYDGLPEKPAQSLEAIQRVVRKYATRLQSVRTELQRRFKPGANIPWMPPDLSALLPEGPEDLVEDEVELGDETIGYDETLSPRRLGLPDLARTARADWAALTWLLWAVGETKVAMPKKLAPPSNFGHAAGMSSQRLWRARDRRVMNGRGAKASGAAGFEFEGVDIDALSPNLVGIVEQQYAEMQAMFYWLVDTDNVSPWQSNLRGS
ncbi:thioredoxin domain-containing protein [Myxococcus stipitatus]|uniref:thioredoxin domain-containing protein n=1 Tax=Myxococcus stipitatus TaxID=83455 RepID=UPI001F3B9F9F|nr:thioredoxin domain-containing protein [Myxococcus stipitatus]MCE9666804.1 thioredoxin domain-containing protein [Myxococcus stipitatus]